MPNTKKYTPEEEAIIAKQKAAIAADPRVRKQRATPEGGRRGFMAGMTGTTKKKNLNRMDADPAREPLQDPGIARGMEIRRKEIENARKYQADQRAKKTAPVKKAATGKTKIPDLSGSSMGSKAPVPFPKKKDTTPYVPPIYPDAEGEDFAKRMRKNYANKGKAAAPTATGPKWKQYKSVAAAKKAGSKYYMGKDGKKKAALYKGDLDKSLSKRDAYNKALGLKRADGSAVEKAKPKKDAKKDTKKDTKKKSFRERRAARMEERLASDSIGEGRKKRIKKRLSRVKRRMGEPKGYAKGGKVRGAGIAQRGVRPCKMR